MKTLINLIESEIREAFAACGYEKRFGAAAVSNRPDLCQYQCNGALPAAKEYKKKPIDIANEVAERLSGNKMFGKLEAVMPGFINITLDDSFLLSYLGQMAADERLGFERISDETVIVDYGGPNVAKPLHVGHLRSAVIGESIKRILRFCGCNAIGDVHLGDWGLQMGLIITELKKRQPHLPYFDDSYTGEYPKEPPFTISELEEIYPYANQYSKDHPEYKEEARHATAMLQDKHRGYYALWQHILNVSVTDLKRNFDNLNVSFELWKKESDAQEYIPEMISDMKQKGHAHLSEGALVVDVAEEGDTKEMPPCILLKADGATLYASTDLATMVERMEKYSPGQIVYLTDKRQDLYFEQIFRAARKTGIVPDATRLVHIGFGTVNGKDGKAFKTRDGGVMRLENLIEDIVDAVYKRIMENRGVSGDEARKTARMVGIAALKYGDLSNQAVKDYVFDIDRFSSFEGNTGPYILYTMVRIKSILSKYAELAGKDVSEINAPAAGSVLCGSRRGEEIPESERNLVLTAVKFPDTMKATAAELAPNKLCQYIYELANNFNSFYHENRIIAEENKEKQSEWIALIGVVLKILELCIDMLGFEAPEKM